MRKLGEQWIEIIDGQEHMLKSVTGCCRDCLFVKTNYKGFEPICEKPSECPTNVQYIIKDLGILRDGMLPCPFCGEYPATDVEGVAYCNTCGCDIDLDKWNRRA